MKSGIHLQGNHGNDVHKHTCIHSNAIRLVESCVCLSAGWLNSRDYNLPRNVKTMQQSVYKSLETISYCSWLTCVCVCSVDSVTKKSLMNLVHLSDLCVVMVFYLIGGKTLFLSLPFMASASISHQSPQAPVYSRSVSPPLHLPSPCGSSPAF